MEVPPRIAMPPALKFDPNLLVHIAKLLVLRLVISTGRIKALIYICTAYLLMLSHTFVHEIDHDYVPHH